MTPQQQATVAEVRKHLPAGYRFFLAVMPTVHVAGDQTEFFTDVGPEGAKDLARILRTLANTYDPQS